MGGTVSHVISQLPSNCLTRGAETKIPALNTVNAGVALSYLHFSFVSFILNLWDILTVV